MMFTADDVRDVIHAIADSRPRNTQAEVGPSEIGAPCARRLGFRLAGIDKVNEGGDPLAPLIGTAMHTLLEESLRGHDDWAVEIGVTLPAYGIRGTLDAYHRPSRTIVDWKIVGASTLRRVKAGDISDQYRIQVHTYALALSMTGVDVDHVAVAFIPRTGMLRDTVVWGEPFDPGIVEAPLRRYETIRDAVTANPREALALLPTAEQWCHSCPWFLPAGTPPTACGGHKDLTPTGEGNTTTTQKEGTLI